jgi:hypothetical protein
MTLPCLYVTLYGRGSFSNDLSLGVTASTFQVDDIFLSELKGSRNYSQIVPKHPHRMLDPIRDG